MLGRLETISIVISIKFGPPFNGNKEKITSHSKAGYGKALGK
jgi:hypothetical protein